MSAHVSTPTPGIRTNAAMLASRDNSWIIDSDTSSHMSGTLTIFYHLSTLSNMSTVTIADGRSCSVSGQGVVQAFSQIRLDNVLYVPEFPINLLSISAITSHLQCYVTFFPFHCTFQDLQTGKIIGLGHKQSDSAHI